jgi:uncharacterized membrane protein
MQRISGAVEIKVSAQRVYEFLTQPSNLPSIWPNMVSVSNVVRRADGSHEFDWIYKMAGVHLKGHAKSEEVQPARLVRIRNESGIPSTFVWKYEARDGAGMRLTVDVEYTVPAPVVGRIAEHMLTRINQRDLDTLLANLKDVMESASAGTGIAVPAQH